MSVLQWQPSACRAQHRPAHLPTTSAPSPPTPNAAWWHRGFALGTRASGLSRRYSRSYRLGADGEHSQDERLSNIGLAGGTSSQDATPRQLRSTIVGHASGRDSSIGANPNTVQSHRLEADGKHSQDHRLSHAGLAVVLRARATSPDLKALPSSRSAASLSRMVDQWSICAQPRIRVISPERAVPRHELRPREELELTRPELAWVASASTRG